MLRGLSIRDMLLIERLDLEFRQGLNVLTGETGAGKSILLDSLGFVLGWRGRAELVREGAKRGEVTAEFELEDSHPAHAILAEAGLDDNSGLIIRRVNFSDGRKQAFVNDRRCSGETLRHISETLVELHGQHDDRGLLNPRGHRGLLDGYGHLGGLVGQCRKRWRSWQSALQEIQTQQKHLAKIREDREYLAHAVEELETLAPKAGEEAELDSQRRLMQASERIRADIRKAETALSNEGAEGLIGDAARWLQGVEADAEGRLQEPIAALGRALEELANAQSGVETCLQALEFNPNELEQVEERLFALRAVARKHNVHPDVLEECAAEFAHRLQEIEAGDGNLAALERKAQTAESEYAEAASALSVARAEAAERLDLAMAQELAPLKLERAVFKTGLEPADAGPEGQDHVRFTVATNPGAPAGALNKIASGGELSRFMLALKVCLHGEAEGVTMIFDEIDRGVGGATADAVGRRLADLAVGGQVLVVTHSPQVAALGSHHFQVSKSVVDAQTRSDVVAIKGADRIAEIARMLAGEEITDEAKAAAKVLLDA